MSYRTAQISPDEGVIVNLAEHADTLMSYEDISGLLSDEQERKLVDYVRAMLQMSHQRIQGRYDSWLLADRAHDCWVPPDATKFREKVVVADTRAIADTVITYLMAALAGRNPMFQLEGLNRKSRKSSAILERVLHQHMRRSAGEARIAQHLLDCVRYGFAPTKVVWDSQGNTNDIVNFDPRKVFPDPRVTWGDWDKMQFIGFVDHGSYDSLLQTGLYPKLRQYPGLRRPNHVGAGWEAHRWHKEKGRGYSIDPMEKTFRENSAQFSLGDSRVVDEFWVRLAGYQLGLDSIETIWLIITVIDESVVIRCQLNVYGQQFPAVIGGLHNDRHKSYSQGLYDILMPLHDIATWLLRSRVDNVQAALSNLIFVDPTQVSVPDLIDRNPWGVVRTLPGVKPGDGVFIAQVPDVTRGHWNDIQAMSELKQRVSAASDAQQGVPTSDGIRTATEIQRLTQLGSQRLGVLARTISATSIRPMVRMMVGNLKDAISMEGSMRVPPDQAGILAAYTQDEYLDWSVQDLQGEVDYMVVDGTLPVEPARSPETWMNILQIASQAGLAMELDMKQMALEAIRAMGVSDIDQFRISPQQMAQGPTPSQQLQIMEKMRGASVMPEEQVQREAERGNLVPFRPGEAA